MIAYVLQYTVCSVALKYPNLGLYAYSLLLEQKQYAF